MRLLKSVRSHVIVGLTTTTLLLGAGGVLALVALQRSHTRMQSAVTMLHEEYDVVQRTVTAILREFTGGLRYLNTRTPEDERRYVVAMEAADRLRREAIALPILAAQEREQLEVIGERQAAIEVGLAQSRAYAALGRTGDATRVLEATASDIEQIDRALDNLQRATARRADERNSQIAGELRRSEVLLGGMLFLAVPLTALFGVATYRAVTRPLGALQQETEAIGAGDLRTVERPDSMEHTEEYAMLAMALDRSRERLRSLLESVQREADEVTTAAEELAASANGAASSTQHVTLAVTEMAQSASEQLDALTAASDAVRNLAEDGAVISEASELSEQAGGEIREAAAQARDQIARAIDTLLGARDVVNASSREIEALREATGSIDSFVALIADIASQTNLLALNAAIEAARAGEAGKGFAVVAEEVRRLADQSADAAEEVARSVQKIRDRVAEATRAADTGVTRMRDVQDVAGAANDALAGVEAAVARVAGAGSQVARAVEQSRTTIRSVEGSILMARDAAQNHAATAEEVAASTEETSASSEEVSATAETLRTAAARMRESVAGFRT